MRTTKECAALVSLDFEMSIISSLDTVFSRLNATSFYLKNQLFWSRLYLKPAFNQGPPYTDKVQFSDIFFFSG